MAKLLPPADSSPVKAPHVPSVWERWWSKLVAIVILANLVLVGFNYTYFDLRDAYLLYWPAVVQRYDPLKGVESHPQTEQYLQTVNTLAQQVDRTGLEHPTTSKILKNLRWQSVSLIDENPFLVADRSNSFAKLKRKIRRQVGNASAKEALATFWTVEFLSTKGWKEQQAFFDAEIRPLLAHNYYRTADENGLFVDRFWQIDLYFILFFGLELLGRTLIVSRRTPGINWLDAIVRRWYELFLLLPFWRWLRVLPALVRLHQSQLLNTKRLLAQATHEPAAYLADRVSNFMLVRLVNQSQASIQNGALLRAIVNPQAYTSVGEEDKIGRLSDRILQIALYKALPQIQPNLEELLRYNLRSALQQSDLYQGLQSLPGVASLPAGAIEQLADYLAQASCEGLPSAYADREGRELFDRLSQDFRQALVQELQDEQSRRELQGLLIDLLEELKVNYLQKAAQSDPGQTLAETEQLEEALVACARSSPSEQES